MKRVALLFLLTTSIANADNITLNAYSFDGSCQLSHRCDMRGVHDIEIVNNTDQNHYYTYSYDICADNGQCNVVSNGVWVGYHSKWNNHFESHLTTTLEWPGIHTVTVKTVVNDYLHEERIDTKHIDVK